MREGSSIKSINKHKKVYLYILIIIICGAAIYLPATFYRDLHWEEEMKYVEVAKEMYDTGNWLVPHFGGNLYSHKPPFYFHFLNLSRFLAGSYSVTAMVMISLISGILIAIVTFFWGSLNFNKRYGFLSALILMITFYFFALSITVRMDHLMGFFIISALFSFYLGYSSEAEGRDRFYYLVYLFMALATWIKGPAGFLIPLVVIPVYLLIQKDLSEFKNLQLKKGILIFIGVILLWLVPALIKGGKEYAYQLLVIQTFGRTVNSFAHQKAFYYYLTTFSFTFLPWSFFLYSTFIYCFKNRRKLPQFIKFLLSWFIVTFILFSLISGKLDIYLLPIYPAGALLVAYLFKEISNQRASKYYIIIPAVITFAFFAVGSFFIPQNLNGIALKSLLMPTIIAWILGGIAGIFLLFKKKYNYISYLVIIMFSVFLLNFSFSMAQPFNQSYTLKETAAELKHLHVQSVNKIATYKYDGDSDALGIYLDFWPEVIEDRVEFSNYLKQDKFAVMMELADWQQIRGDLNNIKSEFEVLQFDQSYIIITNYSN
ncbi:4-amino-4-deoxy-L-arabinose transferase-like glycosyltransferase [Halanaerobium saccharolyticum]|uniref:4-amino-4-deoxy-L-arabinose transferase-like glycosyltransferase n=1 Tax=Halanaerobium saccharolyticum TaxID=43595 RepID=A0A4R6M2Z9_9FIRM|nr:glycosyltransferase family 39 protein [Halanaerobium saccharolyticum]TDO94810.1 4-amino-4-deoxy-L-arabinose transferase-like glycosyltransferase [Halanaerobium saccharolyticum]